MFFNGIRVISDANMPPDYMAVALPVFARNRSVRQWKKLMRHVRDTAQNRWSRVYVIDNSVMAFGPTPAGKTIVAHPTVIEAMSKQ